MLVTAPVIYTRALTKCINGMKYPNIKILMAKQRTKNARFFKTEKSTILIFCSGKFDSFFFLFRLSGKQYAKAARVGMTRKPAKILRVFLQPKFDNSSSRSGPTATVPTPLPDAAIPFASARFLQYKMRKYEIMLISSYTPSGVLICTVYISVFLAWSITICQALHPNRIPRKFGVRLHMETRCN